MSLCVGVSTEVRRGSGSPRTGVTSGWGLSWVLRTELGRATSAVNHGGLSIPLLIISVIISSVSSLQQGQTLLEVGVRISLLHPSVPASVSPRHFDRL